MTDHSITKTSTLGGTLTVLLANIAGGEIVKAAILAATGAAVSYTVSLGMKWLVKKIRQQ